MPPQAPWWSTLPFPPHTYMVPSWPQAQHPQQGLPTQQSALRTPHQSAPFLGSCCQQGVFLTTSCKIHSSPGPPRETPSGTQSCYTQLGLCQTGDTPCWIWRSRRKYNRRKNTCPMHWPCCMHTHKVYQDLNLAFLPFHPTPAQSKLCTLHKGFGKARRRSEHRRDRSVQGERPDGFFLTPLSLKPWLDPGGHSRMGTQRPLLDWMEMEAVARGGKSLECTVWGKKDSALLSLLQH